MALGAAVLDSTEALEPYLAEWDALAARTRRPFCSPAWMLAWWRNVPGFEAFLRVVVVRDEDGLAAVAPFAAEARPGRPAHYRMLAAGTSHRVEPLARPGAEREAAHAIAEALATCDPHPAAIYFDSVDSRSRWPVLLAEAWPGVRSPWTVRERSTPAPTVSLEAGGFEYWLKGKSRNFRSQAARLRRRLEARGARFQVASTREELERGLRAFARLHYGRWEGRGGSAALSPGVERMLVEAGRELLPSGRFRLLTIEADGETISAQVFVAAGGEVSYWNGGFDERWAAEQPAMRALVAAVEDSFARSDTRLDLGGGAHPYKYRLADGEDLLESTLLVPRDGRYPLTQLQLAPRRLRRELATRVPSAARERLRQLRTRG